MSNCVSAEVDICGLQNQGTVYEHRGWGDVDTEMKRPMKEVREVTVRHS